MLDQHFYENQTKKMGSRANIESLISDLKSTQKITKKKLESPMHYSHFLFNIGKLHCDGQTDGETVAIAIPPPNFVCSGGNEYFII